MASIVRSDGNGNTIINVRPHVLGIGTIVTIVLFLLGVVFSAGNRDNRIVACEDGIRKIEYKLERFEKLEKQVTKLTIMVSLLCQKEGIQIPPD